jgi:predicted GIY-YIG superfamily endonuclease
MNLTPKTIQIFLPSGDPRGIRISEITTRIVQTIEIPRSLISDFMKMPESAQVALYFLFGQAEDVESQKVYVGQTGDLRARLASHNKEKEFWQRAVVLISRTNSLTQTHALFLEWYSIQEARKADRYAVENGNSGSKPHTPAPLEADCMEIFETGSTLLATMGYPIFDPIIKQVSPEKPEEFFYCKGSGANGRGIYTEEGFVVFKDSTGRKENVPSVKGTSLERLRERLIVSGVMRDDGDKFVFEKDHLFGSPSMAAFALQGRHANGWTEWKNKDGKTLDTVKRV